MTWIREFGFRFCPEEAKKHWRFEKGSLRTELWFDKHFRFWNQITGRFDLSHYNDREIMIGLSVLSMTVGFMIYGTDVTYRGELSSSHLEVNNILHHLSVVTRSQIQMVHERSPQIFDVS